MAPVSEPSAKWGRWSRRVVAALVLCAVAEGLATLAFRYAWPAFEKARLLMSGEAEKLPQFQRTIGQSYLNYIPSPGLEDTAGVQHNAHGYRGRLVPVRREEGVLRIVCLGGSTTYGWTVDRPEQAYPAQLERLLAESPPEPFEGVEVINAGLPWGTSAELLTHYHFKYHYYRPDLLIVHTGLNDAQAFLKEHYHPDYSHWRQQMIPLPELPAWNRWLARSRAVSAVLIPFFYGFEPNQPTFVRRGSPSPVTAWYRPSNAKEEFIARRHLSLPTGEIAFLHNLKALVRTARARRVAVLLVPVRPAPESELNYRDSIELHETLLLDLAAQQKVPVAPFPADVISEGNWTDAMHVNAAGSLEKARHIEEYVRALWP